MIRESNLNYKIFCFSMFIIFGFILIIFFQLFIICKVLGFVNDFLFLINLQLGEGVVNSIFREIYIIFLVYNI